MLPAIGLTELLDVIAQHMVAMLRIGAFFLASPVFGGNFVPLPVRIMASAVVALPVLAQVPLPTPDQIAGLSFIGVIFSELAIGAAAGLILSILFAAASLAGDRIAATAGLGFAAQYDPAGGGQTPVVASIFSLFLLSVFIGTDGHLVAIRLILESYRLLPIGGALNFAPMVAAGLEAGGRMFSSGAALMLPIITVLLLINILAGVLMRTAPQLNILSFGFPLTMSATMILVFIFAPGLIVSFERIVFSGLEMIRELMEAAHGPAR